MNLFTLHSVLKVLPEVIGHELILWVYNQHLLPAMVKHIEHCSMKTELTPFNDFYSQAPAIIKGLEEADKTASSIWEPLWRASNYDAWEQQGLPFKEASETFFYSMMVVKTVYQNIDGGIANSSITNYISSVLRYPSVTKAEDILHDQLQKICERESIDLMTIRNQVVLKNTSDDTLK